MLLVDRLFYPEKWLLMRLRLANADPRTGGIGNMVNCGAAMYASPVGVVNACDPVGGISRGDRNFQRPPVELRARSSHGDGRVRS